MVCHAVCILLLCNFARASRFHVPVLQRELDAKSNHQGGLASSSSHLPSFAEQYFTVGEVFHSASLGPGCEDGNGCQFPGLQNPSARASESDVVMEKIRQIKGSNSIMNDLNETTEIVPAVDVDALDVGINCTQMCSPVIQECRFTPINKRVYCKTKGWLVLVSLFTV